MAGIQNNIEFAGGFKLQASSSRDISDMQILSTDVSNVNHVGSPEGVVSANPSSLCHDPVSGNIYMKQTGTGNTGWKLITNAGIDLYESPYIVDASGGPGSSFTTIQAAVTQAIADGATTTARNICIRPGTYSENITITTANSKFNFIGITGSDGNATSLIPNWSGTLEINSSLARASVSNLNLTTLTLTSAIETTATNCQISTANISSSLFTSNYCRIITANASSSSTMQFSQSYVITALNVSAGTVQFYNGYCLSVALSGSGSFNGYNAYIGGTSGSSSASCSLNSCSGGSTLLGLTSALTTRGVQGNTLVSRAISSSGNASLENVLMVDTTGGAVTVTLPVGVQFEGYSITIKDAAGSSPTNNITITPTGKTIDNVSSKIISSAWGSLTIFYDGTNFFTL